MELRAKQVPILPMSRAEELGSINAARARFDGRRIRIYGAELHVEKGPAWPPRRLATVLLAELDGYTPYEVVVDLESGSILKATERPELVIPYSSDEIRDAIGLAQSEADLAGEAVEGQLAPAIFYPANHEQGRSKLGRRRLVGVHFLDVTDPAQAAPFASVVVDLSGGRIESVTRYDHSV